MSIKEEVMTTENKMSEDIDKNVELSFRYLQKQEVNTKYIKNISYKHNNSKIKFSRFFRYLLE